ncbi:DUF262 domain-containing protein [Aquimarina sp. RZ0]|uniref:DUF262 domain-containing protein n=1 Tax=Aquimarina sp. RZ0 TaxID=2607730 RepID=UPI0011F212E1|nr:DUF262 domain-containing protein [Aquimarina sp. RZ0]KAA1242520.1 DUF262 domain-containing protein [Aquimarina sp. RZ0]
MDLPNKINVRPDKDRLINLLGDINKGKLVVPKFQRDYVWSVKQRIELFDSISKGFPIGSLLFWNPENDDFGFNNKIGPYQLKLSNKKYSYIIDGYQRITTLFSALTNPNSVDKESIDNTILDDYIIYYNLEDQEFFNSNKSNSSINIPIYALVDTFEFLTYSKKLQEEYGEEKSNLFINRAKSLATSLLDYEIAFVNINGGLIQDAVEIFSRINSRGSDMSPMWMISALTYEEGSDGFKFSDEIDNLKLSLEEFNFGELKTEIILQCIESSTGKIYFDVKTESLAKRSDFKELCLSTFNNIFKAVEFLYNKVNVVNLSLLPYNLQLIFITEFFRLNKDGNSLKIDELERWFWQTTYSSYFSIYSLSKQRKAFKKFQDFAKEQTEKPLYIANNDEFVTADFPNRIFYGSVRSKALALFLIKNVIDSTSEFGNKDLEDFYSFNANDKDFRLMFPKFKELDYKPRMVSLNNRRKYDYSFILKESTVNFNYEANFIEYPIDQKSLENIDDLKDSRYNLISDSESKFVKDLGITYKFSDKYDIMPF